MIVTYEAIDANGRMASDTMEAVTLKDAKERLRDQGMYVTSVIESHNKTDHLALRSSPAKTKGLPLKVLALFTRQMSMLLQSGSAVVPAVAAIRRQMTKPAHGALLDALVTDLEEGTTLTDAMRRHPETFDPVFCAIIAAGEASGSMAPMFERLSLIVGRRRAMRNKILGALAYPALLITMSSHIMLVLLFFVLPRFNVMFIELDVEAPSSTKMLLATGAFMRESWPILLGGVAFVVGTIIGTARSRAGRQWLVDLQLVVPLVGMLRSRLIQAQMFRTLGTLLDSKVGFLEALDLVRDTTTNSRFRRLFDRLEEVVTSGGQPSSAFEESKLVQPYICQAIRTGEDSGTLGGALSYCADILDESNTELVNALARLLEPAILIGMGVVVGAVAISLFLPLFDLTSAIK